MDVCYSIVTRNAVKEELEIALCHSVEIRYVIYIYCIYDMICIFLFFSPIFITILFFFFRIRYSNLPSSPFPPFVLGLRPTVVCPSVCVLLLYRFGQAITLDNLEILQPTHPCKRCHRTAALFVSKTYQNCQWSKPILLRNTQRHPLLGFKRSAERQYHNCPKSKRNNNAG